MAPLRTVSFTAFILIFTSLTTAQLGDILSYKYQRFTECQSLIATCAPTKSSCASYVCAECTDLGDKEVNSCCAGSNPPECFATYGGAVLTSPPAAAATSAAGPGQNACVSLGNVISACESATSGFDNLPDSEAASCMCYAGTTWLPDLLDGYIGQCATYASDVGDTSDYSVLVSSQNFCSSVGDVVNGGSGSAASGSAAGAAATTTTTAAQSSANGVSPTAGSLGTASTPTATTATSNAAVLPLKFNLLSLMGSTGLAVVAALAW